MANYDVELNKQTSLVHKNVVVFFFWHPMLVRPAMKRLFCLKAKNGLIINQVSLKVTPAGACISVCPKQGGGHTSRIVSLRSFYRHIAQRLHCLPVVDRIYNQLGYSTDGDRSNGRYRVCYYLCVGLFRGAPGIISYKALS